MLDGADKNMANLSCLSCFSSSPLSVSIVASACSLFPPEVSCLVGEGEMKLPGMIAIPGKERIHWGISYGAAGDDRGYKGSQVVTGTPERWARKCMLQRNHSGILAALILPS